MNVVEQMLARYPAQDREHALREVMQEIALAGLQRGGFFDKAAFYGGTCLRIFHGLPRFSEDLDFSLLAPDRDFSLEPFFDAMRAEFAAFGFEVAITAHTKAIDSAVVSAFVKKGTSMYDLQPHWKSGRNAISGIYPRRCRTHDRGTAPGKPGTTKASATLSLLK